MKMIEMFEAARKVSVPILAVRTADQLSTIETIAERMTGEKRFPLVQWDAARGLSHVGDAKSEGAVALKAILPKPQQGMSAPYDATGTIPFVEALVACQDLPKGTIVFVQNAHRQMMSTEPLSTAAAVQAVLNLRNTFKTTFRMLVLLGPIFQAPPELEHDVVVLDHALPTPEELEVIVKELHDAGGLAAPTKDALDKAVDAIAGLSAFAAEQVTAMSLKKPGGVDLPMLWERKRVTIEQTQGLKVGRGGERFSDIVGHDALKEHLLRRKNSRTPIGVVLFMDEIDKVFANLEHDTTGVKMDQFRTFLTEMEDNEWRGFVGIGVPGGGKTLLGKAFGNEVGVPTINVDLGAMESQFVGASEALLRHAMQIIKAVGRGNAYVIATSNNASVMRPEMQRRFTDGMWFFDLMSDAERAAALAFYVKKYELKKGQVDRTAESLSGWTGAEVRNACRYAWDTGCSIGEASRFVVPVAHSRVEEIIRLRQFAHGRLLDTTKGGTYEKPQNDDVVTDAVRRVVATKDVLRAMDLGDAKVN